MKDGKLEVGDVLHFEDIDTIKRREIRKISKGVATSTSGNKFEERLFNRSAYMISPIPNWKCHLETPELKAKFEAKAMVTRIRNAVHKLDVEKLKRINDILNEE